MVARVKAEEKVAVAKKRAAEGKHSVLYTSVEIFGSDGSIRSQGGGGSD